MAATIISRLRVATARWRASHLVSHIPVSLPFPPSVLIFSFSGIFPAANSRLYREVFKKRSDDAVIRHRPVVMFALSLPALNRSIIFFRLGFRPARRQIRLVTSNYYEGLASALVPGQIARPL
jgi:hypothetical protein